MADASVRPLSFTVRSHMGSVHRFVFVGCLSVVLPGCDAYANAKTEREAVSLRALARPGSSAESIRSSLTQRGYGCSDGTGPFLTEAGSTASSPHFVYCSKEIAVSLFCAYRVQVIVVPREPAPDVHVHPGSACL
jgi:hypothetical protein